MIISALVALLAMLAVAERRDDLGLSASGTRRGQRILVHADARDVVVPASRSVSCLLLSWLAGGIVRGTALSGRKKVLRRRSIALRDVLLYRALFFCHRNANRLI